MLIRTRVRTLHSSEQYYSQDKPTATMNAVIGIIGRLLLLGKR